MNLVDTHAHLYWESYQEDLDQVIQRSIKAGVTTIINVGVDVDKSKIALKQVQDNLSRISGLSAYSTIGIHPHESVNYSSDASIHTDIAELERIYQTSPNQIVAVGECGLDYKEIEEEQKALQRKLFQAQIDLARKLNLSLIVHCRDDRSTPIESGSKDPENSEAWDKVIGMVGNHTTILHCYSGFPKTTDQVLALPNIFISFAATLTYPKNEYLREAAKKLSLDRIVLETDCPFLPPQSKRGTRNEPANILEIAQLIAKLKTISVEEVARQTTENVKEIFRLRSG